MIWVTMCPAMFHRICHTHRHIRLHRHRAIHRHIQEQLVVHILRHRPAQRILQT